MIARAIAIIRLAVVSSRIFVCPCSRNDIVGRQVESGEHPADVVGGLVERVARRDVGVEVDRELPVGALQRARPEAALEPRDVVDADRTRSPTATVSLPIGSTSRRWLSSTRILTGYCSALPRRSRSSSPDTTIAAARRRRSSSGRRGRPRAADRPRRGSPGWRCSGRSSGRRGSAASAPVRARAANSPPAVEVGAEQVRRDREAARPSPPPSGLRLVMLGR